MSSFLFLTFCVYVFRCLGLHFSEFILLGLSSGGFYLCRTNLHRGLTPGQQGLSEAWVVSFPYPASKTAQRATQGRVWLSLSFPGALLLRQTSKLSFQVVVDSFLDGPDGELQGAIPHLTRLSTYLSGFHIDELFLLQLPNVLGNCVGAHPGVLAYATNAGPALVSFPVLAEHQVSINRQFART